MNNHFCPTCPLARGALGVGIGVTYPGFRVGHDGPTKRVQEGELLLAPKRICYEATMMNLVHLH